MASEGVGRFRLYKPAELDDLPEPNWLIEGILPANALGVLYGASGVGKTFVALSMALSIAAAHSWCGKPTKSGSVLYVAAEGVSGMRLRVQAYQRRHGIFAEQIRYLGDVFDLRRMAEIEELISTLKRANFRPDLIVLDTLARLIPGADENSSKDMGEAIRAMDGLRRAFDATVLLIHHTGKNGELERGSGALRGAADVMIKCSTRGDRKHVRIECDKMKDAELFRDAVVGLERVQISASDSSLAVADLRSVAKDEAGHVDAAIAGHVNSALKVLAQFGPSGATYTKWLNAFRASTKRSKKTFDRALTEIKSDDRGVHWDGERYYARQGNEGVQCQEVSEECHDTSHVGVISSPPLGDDTAAIGQK
jgi:DNA transposition AAA+ family ATPase